MIIEDLITHEKIKGDIVSVKLIDGQLKLFLEEHYSIILSKSDTDKVIDALDE